MSQTAAEGGAAAASGGRPLSPASSSLPAIDGRAAEPIAGAAEDGQPPWTEREAGGARPLTYGLPPKTGKEMKEVEECIEEMLIRLDEFCGMTDMIRSDTSILLEEMIPLIKAKVSEMNNVYTKVDKLEAFVKMAGHHVSFLEEQIIQAEKIHAGCPSIQKQLGSLVFPLFKKDQHHQDHTIKSEMLGNWHVFMTVAVFRGHMDHFLRPDDESQWGNQIHLTTTLFTRDMYSRYTAEL